MKLSLVNIYNLMNGDWGLGIGDWGLGIGPNPQSPIPNPQSPIPNYTFIEIKKLLKNQYLFIHKKLIILKNKFKHWLFI